MRTYTSNIAAFENYFDAGRPHTYSNSEITKTSDGYSIAVLLPGYNREEIEVLADNETLTIEASTDRSLPKFLGTRAKKTFEVVDLDPESVEAKLEAGILSIKFRCVRKNNSRSIEVL
jgi:HSP20 family molecular chaperone IbpA